MFTCVFSKQQSSKLCTLDWPGVRQSLWPVARKSSAADNCLRTRSRKRSPGFPDFPISSQLHRLRGNESK